MLSHLKETRAIAAINSTTSPPPHSPHHIRQVNNYPGPIRLHLIGQRLVGIEHGLDCAFEVAIVVLAEGVELFEAAFKPGVDRAFESEAFLGGPTTLGRAGQFFERGGIQVEVIRLGSGFERLDDQQVRERFDRFHAGVRSVPNAAVGMLLPSAGLALPAILLMAVAALPACYITQRV